MRNPLGGIRCAARLAVMMALLAGCGAPAPSPSPATSAPSDTPTIPAATTTPSATITTTAVPTWTPSPTRTITPGPSPTAGPDAHPAPDLVWFHDEANLVYTYSGGLCNLRAGVDAPVFLAPSAGIPEWSPGIIPSPDKAMVAFLKRYSYGSHVIDELWVVGLDGTGLRRVLSLSDMAPLDWVAAQHDNGRTVVDYEWLPGTHTIAFTTGYLYYGYEPYNDLNLVNADTGKVVTLLPPGSGGFRALAAPDGFTLAFIRYGNSLINQGGVIHPNTISFIDADGSNLKRDVFSYVTRIVSQDNFNASPGLTWQRQSLGLWVGLAGQNPLRIEPTEVEGWFAPRDGSAPQRVFQLDAISYSPMEMSAPDMSPDGTMLAFEGTYQEKFGLHLFNVKTGEHTVYAEGPAHFAGWDDDSMHFVYNAAVYPVMESLMRGAIGEAPVPLPGPNGPTDAPRRRCE